MFDPYRDWLGISTAQRPPSHCQLLGIAAGEQDPNLIEEAVVRQTMRVLAYQDGPYAAVCARLLHEIAQAQVALLHLVPPGREGAGPRPAPAQPLPRRPAWGKDRKRIVILLAFGLVNACVLLLILHFVFSWGQPTVETTPDGHELQADLHPASPPKSEPSEEPEVTPSLPPSTARADRAVTTPGPREPPAGIAPTKPEPGEIKRDPSVKPSLTLRPPRPLAPLPEAAQQARVEANLKALFKKDYERTRTADRLALAEKLFDTALDTPDDAPARFVLLREARDLAARAGDAPLALKAVAEIARGFAIDRLAMTETALTTAAAEAYTPATHRAVAESVLGVLDDALLANDFPRALRLLPLAEAAAHKVLNLPLQEEVRARFQTVRAMQKEYAEVLAAADTLRRRPDDSAAPLVIGMYVCCRRGDWDRGLPLLARGNDPAFRTAAVKDLASPTRPQAQVEVADAWWTLAATQAGHVRAALQGRAGFWYQQALPHLTGLTRDRVKENLKGISQHPPGLRLPDPVGELRVLEGHRGPVTGVAVTPDGGGVVTGSLDGTVRLWSLATSAESRKLAEPPGEIHGVAIAPDGRRVLAGGTHGIALWNLENGLALYRATQPGPVQRVAFAPSGEQFVYAGDRGVGVYDVEPPRLRVTLPAGPGWAPARGVALLPRGLLLFLGGDGRVRLGQMDKAADTAPFTRAGALCGALSPDCRLLVLGGTDKTVRLLDLVNLTQFRTLRGHTRPVTSVAFSADGRRVLSGSEDRTVRLWEVASGREVERFAWHTDTVLSVAFAPNGRLAVSGSADQTARVWLLPK